jgi:uncharacterized protein YggE
MKIRYILWISALVLAASALAGVGAPLLLHADTGTTTTGRTLSVFGTGVITTKPDTATLSAGVTTPAAKASGAIAANATSMAELIDALKATGIDSKDLQTELVSLDPRYDDNGTTIVGYNATNSVSVLVRDFTQVGGVIDAAVAAGANNVSGPSLARNDTEKLYRDALEEAAAQARLKATALARAAGVTLGEIRSVSEGTQEVSPVNYAGAAIAKDSAATPIEPGSAQVTASVRIVYAID